MPKKTDITENDQELDASAEGDQENTENSQGEPEDGADKPTGRANDANTLQEIKQTLQGLQRLVAGDSTKRSDQARVSRLESEFSELSKEYKPEQLKVLARIAVALKEDMVEEYGAAKQKEATQGFDQQCFDRAYDEIEKVIDQFPGSQSATVREALMAGIVKDVGKLMASDNRFEAARSAYQGGRVPAREDFSKAVRLIAGTYLKESGMTLSDKKGASDQLDTRTSRSRPQPIVSKDGTVDVSKLSDWEREIYNETLNKTKNKDLALKALKALGQVR